MDGQCVIISDEVIGLRSSPDGGRFITIKLARLAGARRQAILSPRAQHLVKLYLVDRTQRRKSHTVENDFQSIHRFDAWLATAEKRQAKRFEWSDLEETIGRRYLDYGVKNTSSKGNDFSRIRAFYRWGVAHRYSDFNLQTLQDLEAIRAIGNSKGHHVRFHHPTSGPLSTDEKILVARACDSTAASAQDRAVVLLHLELGINPNSTARIKNDDLKIYFMNGISTYQLNVPRLKKRTTKRETRRRNISPRLGSLIESLKPPNAAPDKPLFFWLNELHPEADIAATMRRFVRKTNLKSPRTGELLKLHPRRCRTTLGTHMAEEGASKFHIAEVLDHTDLQNVGVYTETVSSIADDVSRATDIEMTPLVDRFLGKVVDSLSATERSQTVPMRSPHINLPILNVGNVGGCGRNLMTDGLCELFPPLSCYLCPFFAALRTGPHREVLESLESFVRNHEEEVDTRILRQLNETILAIRAVLKRLPSNSGRDQGASN